MADDDIDDETLANFTRILEKVGLSWLDKVRPSRSSPDPRPPGPEPGGLTEFLQKALDKAEAAQTKLMEELDRYREVLTPEQSTLLRSLKSGVGDPLALSGLPNNVPPPPPPAEQPPVRRKRNWL